MLDWCLFIQSDKKKLLLSNLDILEGASYHIYPCGKSVLETKSDEPTLDVIEDQVIWVRCLHLQMVYGKAENHKYFAPG